MSTFENQLKQWAEEAVPVCHEIAIKLDLSFYAFQSPPPKNENLDLLLLGINPGNEYSYSDQYNNSIWGLVNHKRMIPEVFIKGNPLWNKRDENWPIWQNLKKSFEGAPQMNILLSNSMFMNLIYFNTNSVNSLSQKEDIINIISKCQYFSLKLIEDIIKPKKILCLGKSCFRSLPIIPEKSNNKFVLKGKLKKSGTPVYGILHPSGKWTRGIFLKNSEDIGTELQKEFGFI